MNNNQQTREINFYLIGIFWAVLKVFVGNFVINKYCCIISVQNYKERKNLIVKPPTILG